jgi:predicted nucleic acid-binding protein
MARELAEQQLRIQEAAQAARAAGGPPALEILSGLFQLGTFDRDVLLLCLAPAIDVNFERLYAYVHDDATRKWPTLGLAAQLFGPELFANSTTAWQQCCARFAPDAPLRRFRLVHCDPASAVSRSSEILRLDPRIGDYLLGVNHMDEQTAAFVQAIESQGNLGRNQEETVERLERRLRAWNDREHLPAIQLIGATTVGPKAIAQQLSARCGIVLYALDPARLPAGVVERQACYRLLERDALLLPCAYYLDCTEIDATSRAEAAQALEFVQQVRAFVLLASRGALNSERPLITVNLVKSDSATQLAVWKAELAGRLADADSDQCNDNMEMFLNRMIQQFHFDPQQIHRVVRAAGAAAALRNPESPALEQGDLWLAARGHAVRSMEGLAEKIEARRSLEDLVLPREQLQQIQEIASQVAQRGRVYEQWGFGARLNRGRGIAALFAGPSGTGKTMAAEVVAHHLQLDLYRIDLSSVISKYIGETEKNLRRVFDAAEESGAILLFDEADALFGKRSEVRDSHDRYANIEINYLLQRMEDYRGLAILATNRKSLLDQAFLRRLRFLVDFPFPSAADRVRIWRGAFPPQAQVGALDFEFLGRLEVSGGNISNIALNAAFLAAGENAGIHMNHVMTAARREYAKIDKLAMEGEFIYQPRTAHR